MEDYIIWMAGLICLFIGMVAGAVITLMLAISGHIKIDEVHLG